MPRFDDADAAATRAAFYVIDASVARCCRVIVTLLRRDTRR